MFINLRVSVFPFGFEGGMCNLIVLASDMPCEHSYKQDGHGSLNRSSNKKLKGQTGVNILTKLIF